MSNATKTLLALFAVLLVLTGIVKLTGNGSSSKGLQSAVIKLDSAKVDKIQINTPKNGKVTLLKQKGKWEVRGHNEQLYPADKNQVDRAIGQLTGLMPNAIVTRDKKSFTRYQVDTTGTKVTFFNGGNQLASIILGRFAFASRRSMNTYVRPAGKDIVYTVDGYLSAMYNQKPDDWRDKKIWTIDKTAVKQVDMKFPADSSYSMTNAGKNLWMYGSDSLKTSMTTNIIQNLADLRADGFKDSIKPSDFGTPLYQIDLQMDNGTSNTLKIKPDKKDKNMYILTASNYPYVFTKNKSTIKDQILKRKQDLIMNKKK
ncbi:MAG TPA: DUF4340 domain-containing protein [Balneolales bacterium]|nr:DUF4340 domain-containing protein [Balneolales bacterium]